MNLLLADRSWPDGIDTLGVIWFAAVAVLFPIVGYILMVIDIRAYLRALRGALVRVVHHFPGLPAWARYETPACLRGLGLRLPCTQVDVKRAYRQLAEQLHPDRGGDRQRFHRLRQDCEQALEFLEQLQADSEAEDPVRP